jgi:hypothetical protein
MRVTGTYAKDAPVGECSMDGTFNITATLALTECGLLNAASAGTLYCRDTYTVKNVVSGDTVKALEKSLECDQSLLYPEVPSGVVV